MYALTVSRETDPTVAIKALLVQMLGRRCSSDGSNSRMGAAEYRFKARMQFIMPKRGLQDISK